MDSIVECVLGNQNYITLTVWHLFVYIGVVQVCTAVLLVHPDAVVMLPKAHLLYLMYCNFLNVAW